MAVGMDSPEQLKSNLEVVKDTTLNEEDQAILRQVQIAQLYKDVCHQKTSSFMQ